MEVQKSISLVEQLQVYLILLLVYLCSILSHCKDLCWWLLLLELQSSISYLDTQIRQLRIAVTRRENTQRKKVNTQICTYSLSDSKTSLAKAEASEDNPNVYQNHMNSNKGLYGVGGYNDSGHTMPTGRTYYRGSQKFTAPVDFRFGISEL